MVSKRFVQMVFPFFAEEAKRKAELEELALSAEQDEEDVFDFGGMRWLRISEGVIHSPTSHRTCDVAALRQLWTRKSSVAQWAVCVCPNWILLYISSSSYWLTSCEVGYQPHQLWIYLPYEGEFFMIFHHVERVTWVFDHCRAFSVLFFVMILWHFPNWATWRHIKTYQDHVFQLIEIPGMLVQVWIRTAIHWF